MTKTAGNSPGARPQDATWPAGITWPRGAGRSWHQGAAAAAAAVGMLMAGTLAGGGQSLASSSPGSSAGPIAAPPAAGLAATAIPAPGALGRPVFLPTGDRLLAREVSGGGQAVVPLPGAAPSSLIGLRVGGRVLEIPADALPFLGRGLDPGLFDVAVLERAEQAGRLAVSIGFTGRRPALPGVRITQSGQHGEQGYLTAASATAFGAALARQSRADHARASYGADGLFAAGLTIAPAGTPARHRTGRAPALARRGGFRLHTLTVTATSLAGRPDTGDEVLVVNADNPARFDDPNADVNVFDHGAARFSVPAGHYLALGLFASLNAFGGLTGPVRLVVLPQFTVSRNASVGMAEQSASSQVGFTTPRPAVLAAPAFALFRRAANGETFGIILSEPKNSFRLWVSPTTRKPTVGDLSSVTTGILASPPGAAGPPYAYNIASPGPDGIIPRQQFRVSPAGLATVHERFYQDGRATGTFCSFAGFSFLLFAGGCDPLPLRLPGTRTEYFSAGPATVWASGYFVTSAAGGGQTDTWRTLQTGRPLTVNWNAYPLHTQADIQPLRGAVGAQFAEFPTAEVTGDTLWLAPDVFSDNTPGHFSSGIGQLTQAYAVYQDGRRIAHGSGIGPVQLSARPSLIRFVLTDDGSSSSSRFSLASTTAWTWRFVPRPGATVPPQWACFFHGLVTTQQCAVQPMLTLDYQVHGMALNGTTPPGRQQIGFTAGHIQLTQDSRVTRASAQVSFDGGKTWHAAAVTPADGGRFRIGFTAPARALVTLRVSAQDAAGGSVTETIHDAYGVAP
jgi:hypothetical protein